MYDVVMMLRKATREPIYLRLLNIQFLLQGKNIKTYYCLANALTTNYFAIGIIIYDEHYSYPYQIRHDASEIFTFSPCNGGYYTFLKNRFDIYGINDQQQQHIDYINRSLQHTMNIYKQHGII
jgi:hypothetical protein